MNLGRGGKGWIWKELGEGVGERTGLKIFEMLKEKNILKMAEEFKTTEFLFTKNHV